MTSLAILFRKPLRTPANKPTAPPVPRSCALPEPAKTRTHGYAPKGQRLFGDAPQGQGGSERGARDRAHPTLPHGKVVTVTLLIAKPRTRCGGTPSSGQPTCPMRSNARSCSWADGSTSTWGGQDHGRRGVAGGQTCPRARGPGAGPGLDGDRGKRPAQAPEGQLRSRCGGREREITPSTSEDVEHVNHMFPPCSSARSSHSSIRFTPIR